MKLKASQVAASRPMVTPYKMTDGGGLYLEVISAFAGELN
ncbi:hypothetical protein OOC_01280 [Providencia rettgeri Dmel1]|nr:hypothetical protein OOC_01280 [Providencia rettgeri Dmel1]